MKLKILTLNIWNYHDFEKRKLKIVSLIRRYDPDIIAFQEIRDDRSRNDANNDQLVQLNKLLCYDHSYFLRVENVGERKGITTHECYEGLGICSRFPFEAEGIRLKKHPDDTHVRKVLHAKVDISQYSMDIFVVHFSPDDKYAKLHMEEAMKTVKNKKKTIVLGDFNFREMKTVSMIAHTNGFASSSDFEYISYPADACSYDYIFISKEMRFNRFKCLDEDVSDHRALFSEIIL